MGVQSPFFEFSGENNFLFNFNRRKNDMMSRRRAYLKRYKAPSENTSEIVLYQVIIFFKQIKVFILDVPVGKGIRICQ
jgi:hypothetical protein